MAALPQVDGVPMKNSQAVDFQEQLNFGPFMAPAALDGGPARYRLYGIIVHEGTCNSPHSGHYVAYVRGADGRWWECNDAQVGHLPKFHYPSRGETVGNCSYSFAPLGTGKGEELRGLR